MSNHNGCEDVGGDGLRPAAADTWKCGALAQGTAGGNDPADCDWPTCGCDPYANKVLYALEEAQAFYPSWATIPDVVEIMMGFRARRLMHMKAHPECITDDSKLPAELRREAEAAKIIERVQLAGGSRSAATSTPKSSCNVTQQKG